MIDSSKYQRHQQYVAYLMSEFTVPHLVRLVRRYDGDVLLAIVLGEIAQHNVRRFFESPEVQSDPSLQVNDGEGSHQEALMSACNALSISEATGIPRETVRRKVKELEQRGWLIRQGARSLTLAPRAIEQMGASGRAIMEDFRDTASVIRMLEEAFSRQQQKRQR